MSTFSDLRTPESRSLSSLERFCAAPPQENKEILLNMLKKKFSGEELELFVKILSDLTGAAAKKAEEEEAATQSNVEQREDVLADVVARGELRAARQRGMYKRFAEGDAKLKRAWDADLRRRRRGYRRLLRTPAMSEGAEQELEPGIGGGGRKKSRRRKSKRRKQSKKRKPSKRRR